MRDRYYVISSGVAWLALIVAVIALIFAVISYDKVKNLDAKITETVNSLTEPVKTEITALREGQAIKEASSTLSGLRSDIENKQNTDQAVNTISQVQTNLKNTFSGSSGVTLDNWKKANQDLAKLANEVKSQSANAPSDLNTAINDINNINSGKALSSNNSALGIFGNLPAGNILPGGAANSGNGTQNGIVNPNNGSNALPNGSGSDGSAAGGGGSTQDALKQLLGL